MLYQETVRGSIAHQDAIARDEHIISGTASSPLSAPPWGISLDRHLELPR